jgi:hypothetical protein
LRRSEARSRDQCEGSDARQQGVSIDFHSMTPLNPSYGKVPIAKLVRSGAPTRTRADGESFRFM